MHVNQSNHLGFLSITDTNFSSHQLSLPKVFTFLPISQSFTNNPRPTHLLVVGIAATAAGSHHLPLDAAGAAGTIGRGEGELDVLLLLDADQERGDVHHLALDTVRIPPCQPSTLPPLSEFLFTYYRWLLL